MLAAMVLAGILTTAIGGGPGLRLLAAGAGVLLVGLAAWSIVRRRPVLATMADGVTLARAVLGGGCATVAVLAIAGALPLRSWWLVALAAPALLLDAVDGPVARRTGTAGAPGARLDMETDAAFLLVLSAPLALVLGPWAAAIGAMRYLFVAASWWRPALRGQLDPSTFRRVVAATQGVVLVVASLPVMPTAVAVPAVAAALALLVVSFARDVVRLERTAGARHGGADAPAVGAAQSSRQLRSRRNG